MTETQPNPVLRLLPSMTDVAFLLPLILLFGGLAGVQTMLGDCDTGWHVRTGQWILAHYQVPRQDMFSFTMPGQTWYAWEWLWEACFAWLFERWGMGSVVLVSVLVVCSTSALLYRLVYRRCGNPLVAVALTGLAIAGSSIHWLARPHLFTMLFMVVFMTVLERVREGRPRLLWTLPAITILWTNLHGGFLVGILIVGCYGAGELLRAAIGRDREERLRSLRGSAAYLAAAAGCAAASLVNPYGYRLHQHILEYLGDPYLTKYIGEFLGTNFKTPAAVFLELMLVMGLGAAVWYGQRKQFTEVLMILGFGHLSLLMIRNMPIYVLLAAPIVAAPLMVWLRALAGAPVAQWLRASFSTFLEIGEELIPLERIWRWHLAPVAVVLLLAAAIASPAAGNKFKPEFDPQKYPQQALAALSPAGERILGPGERIFTQDEWGDYLIYKSSPEGTKVFIDGRSDFYGGKFGQEYIDAINVKYTWQQTLDRYRVDTVLLPVDASLAGALKESRRWRVAYDDGMAIVFRPAAEMEGRMEQVFTGNTGGMERHNPEIVSVKQGVRKDHLN